MKKLSLLLVLCIIISSYAPFTAFADTDYTCEFIGGMAVLNDNIELNLYMKLSNDLLIDSNYVNISYTNVSEKVYFNTLTGKYNSEIDGYNVYTVKLPPKKIDETITITSYINGNSYKTSTYSLRQYLQDLQTTSQDNDSLKKLAQATEDYCTFASVYFNKISVPENMMERKAVVDAVQSNNNYSEQTKITVSEEDAPSKIAYIGTSLELESSVSMRFYFKLNNDTPNDFNFTVDGIDVSPKKRQTYSNDEIYYYVEISNIKVSEFATSRSIKVALKNNGRQYMIIQASPCTYAHAIRTKATNEYNPNFITLLKSLILYYRAAKDYTTN